MSLVWLTTFTTHHHVSRYISSKTRTGDEKDDNNGISKVSVYTPPSGRINSKRIWADQLMRSARILLLFILSEGGVHAETLEIPLLSSFSSPVRVSSKIYPFLHEKLIRMLNFNTIITFAMVARTALWMANMNKSFHHAFWVWGWAGFWFHSLATLMKCPENNEQKQTWVCLTLKLKI